MGCDFEKSYIYGKLNRELKERAYKGGESDTASVTIDNKTNTISVGVNKEVFLGDSGELTITPDQWVDGIYTISSTTKDAFFFSPKTIEDREAISNSQLFVSSTEDSIIFSVIDTPTSSISLLYFIAKGSADSRAFLFYSGSNNESKTGVSSIGGATGNILLGRRLTMVDNTLSVTDDEGLKLYAHYLRVSPADESGQEDETNAKAFRIVTTQQERFDAQNNPFNLIFTNFPPYGLDQGTALIPSNFVRFDVLPNGWFSSVEDMKTSQPIIGLTRNDSIGTDRKYTSYGYLNTISQSYSGFTAVDVYDDAYIWEEVVIELQNINKN